MFNKTFARKLTLFTFCEIPKWVVASRMYDRIENKTKVVYVIHAGVICKLNVISPRIISAMEEGKYCL